MEPVLADRVFQLPRPAPLYSPVLLTAGPTPPHGDHCGVVVDPGGKGEGEGGGGGLAALPPRPTVQVAPQLRHVLPASGQGGIGRPVPELLLLVTAVYGAAAAPHSLSGPEKLRFHHRQRAADALTAVNREASTR